MPFQRTQDACSSEPNPGLIHKVQVFSFSYFISNQVMAGVSEVKPYS